MSDSDSKPNYTIVDAKSESDFVPDVSSCSLNPLTLILKVASYPYGHRLHVKSISPRFAYYNQEKFLNRK